MWQPKRVQYCYTDKSTDLLSCKQGKRILEIHLVEVIKDTLVKIEDGFYLNSQHIIAVHVSKNPENGLLEISIQYTPHSVQQVGEYKKVFQSQLDAEIFLSELNQKLR